LRIEYKANKTSQLEAIRAIIRAQANSHWINEIHKCRSLPREIV